METNTVIAIVMLAALGLYIISIFFRSPSKKAPKDIYADLPSFPSGKYLSGLSTCTTPQVFTHIVFVQDAIKVIRNPIYGSDEYGTIPLKNIADVKIENKSSLERRITATRLLTIGIFAFAAKKKEKIELKYLVIECIDGKFKRDVIFEFSGKSAVTQSNTLLNEIIKHVNELEK